MEKDYARSLMAWPAFGQHPYQDLLYAEMARRGWCVSDFTGRDALLRPASVVHLHWPDLVLEEPARGRAWKALALLALVAVARLRGRQVVWTVHNPILRREQATWWARTYLRLLARLCSGVILLSEAHVGAYGADPNRKPVAVIPHPHFRRVYGEPREQMAARERLGLGPDLQVIGFFGRVRPYKDLEALVHAFRGLDDDRVRLLVAGEVDETCRHIVEELKRDRRALVIDDYIAAEEVAWLLAAIDLLVLPYHELGNSGVALLSLSYGRPVLAPANAVSVREMGCLAGEGWIQAYEKQLTPAALRAGLRPSAIPTQEPDLRPFAPERVADMTHEFLVGLASRHVEGAGGRSLD
jgi:beta-1,4-mannosyltransferase